MSCLLRKNNSSTSATTPMVLCLGAVGVGKTLLLQQLQKGPSSKDVLTPTIPTTGTNLYTIGFGRKRQTSVVVRELGGTMAPLWSQYYSEGNAIIFLVDLSNAFQISASTMLLLDVLSNPALKDRPFLLVFNKCDCKRLMMSVSEMKDTMQLPSIIQHAKQKITVMEASAVTAEGMHGIKEWIQSNTCR